MSIISGPNSTSPIYDDSIINSAKTITRRRGPGSPSEGEVFYERTKEKIESERNFMLGLINRYKAQINRQIDLNLNSNKSPQDKERIKKYYLVFQEIFNILEKKIVGVSNVILDQNLINNLIRDRYEVVVNGLNELFLNFEPMIETIGMIIDNTNFPHPIEEISANSLKSLANVSRDSEGNAIDSTNGRYIDEKNKYSLIIPIVDMNNQTRDFILTILCRPRRYRGNVLQDPNDRPGAPRIGFSIKDKPQSRLKPKIYFSIDLDLRDQIGKIDTSEGLPTVTFDLKFPSVHNLFHLKRHTQETINNDTPEINNWEIVPVLREVVLKMDKELGQGKNTYHNPTGIQLQEKEFNEFLSWIIDRLQ
jgi:hypothetical protein